MLALIKAWLQAPVVVNDGQGGERRVGGKGRHRGTPQGGVISPLLANLYMRRFLLAWQRWEAQLEAYVCNYADDFVILCKGTAGQALAVTRRLMERLKLELNEEKTRIVDAWAEQFDFPGYTFGAQYSPRTGVRYPGAVPSKARVRRLQKAVHDYLQPHNQPRGEEVVGYLNRLLDGLSTPHVRFDEKDAETCAASALAWVCMLPTEVDRAELPGAELRGAPGPYST